LVIWRRWMCWMVCCILVATDELISAWLIAIDPQRLV
jgi:hypothetical protein